jgi:Fe-S-cluster-containing dehydrogenase component
MPNSFVFDPNRCTGCDACRVACGIENQLEPEKSWRRIDTFNRSRLPGIPLYHLSQACNHCREPACMYACPALAYSRDEETGAVLLHEDKCIGCKYCAWACPYDAPVFDRPRGVMTKCTFCVHRLKEGMKPACAALCPTGALDFADLPESALENEIDGFPRTDLGPRIQIQPLKAGRSLPVMAAPQAGEPFVAPPQPPTTRVSLASEWSLVLFTTLVAALVAAVAATFRPAFTVKPIWFLDAAVVTMGLASLHLGKVSRAYRAVLNLRRSWLSREVVAVSAFLGLAMLHFWFAPDSRPLAAAATLVGFLALYCTDQIYSVLKQSRPAHLHSASVVWTGLFLIAVFTGTFWLATVFGFGKLALYVIRKIDFMETGRPVRPIVSAARIGIGLVAPALIWVFGAAPPQLGLIACVMLGELLDRGEYYAELESESPSRQMAIDLSERATADSQALDLSHSKLAT